MASVTTEDAATEGSVEAPGVVVIEPDLPRRVRRPADLVRLVVAVASFVLALVLGDIAVGTAGGLEQDLISASTGLPNFLLQVFRLVAGVGVVLVPVVVGIDLVVRKRGWQLGDALLAGLLAALANLVFRWLVLNAHLGGVVDALTKAQGDGRTPPLDGLVVVAVAYLTVADLENGKLTKRVATLFVGCELLTGFLSGGITALALLVSLLLGWSVGLAVRYGLGAASTRPNGYEVVAALHRSGLQVDRLEARGDADLGARRYEASGPAGPIDVRVLDRDTFGRATFRRLVRRLTLRGPATRGPFLSVRAALEHQSLMALALERVGVPAPEPLAAAEVGPSSALLAFRASEGAQLEAGGDLTDERLAAVWAMLARLQQAQIAHRGLTAENVLVRADGRVGTRDVGSGDIAAPDLALRLDVAQLLVTVALVVGPERATDSAVRALGPDVLLRALPLLQKVALSRSTRRQLSKQKTLLRDVREQVLKLAPDGEPVEAVELRRVTFRSVVTVVGGGIAAYVLLTQLGRVDLADIISSAQWPWVVAVVAFTALTFTGASLVLSGAVTVKLRFLRTYLTQLAVSFTGLVAPAAIGNIALNSRYLQRAGMEPAVAAASVGVAQLAQFCSYFLLLVVSGILAGTGPRASFTPPAAAVVVVLIVIGILLATLAVPAARRLITGRVRPLVQQVVPRIVALFQRPSKVATLLGGALLLDTSFVAALTCATKAFGANLSIPTVAVVYFAGAIVGSAVPTPGGLGGIEAALSAGLIAAGLSSSVAVSSVLLYRLATYWLPIPFGWVSLNYLQREGAI